MYIGKEWQQGLERERGLFGHSRIFIQCWKCNEHHNLQVEYWQVCLTACWKKRKVFSEEEWKRKKSDRMFSDYWATNFEKFGRTNCQCSCILKASSLCLSYDLLYVYKNGKKLTHFMCLKTPGSLSHSFVLQ